MEKNDFKLDPAGDNIVELAFDTPKDGTNAYGAWWLYGVKKDGLDTSFFVKSPNLHKKLSEYGKGAKLNIKKEEYAPNKYAWEVHALGGSMKSNPIQTTASNNSMPDNRTLDIHKQVCLKLAVQSMAHIKFDIKAVEERMYQLLDVLHGSRANPVLEKVKEVFDGKVIEEEKLPF